MELDQLIFQKVANYLSHRRTEDPVIKARTIHLDEHRNKLLLIARALCGEAVDIAPSEREGGWKDHILFLPEKMHLFPDSRTNLLYYYYRIFFLAVQRTLGLNFDPSHSDSSTESAQTMARKTAPIVLKQLFSEYPTLQRIHNELLRKLPRQDKKGRPISPDTSWLYGRWMKNDLLPTATPDLLANNDNHSQTPNPEDHPITTTLKAKHADEIEVIQVDREKQAQYTLTHNFEKVETVDEFDGTWRDFDGDDALEDESNALSQLRLSKVVRVDDPVHSVYQAEFVTSATIAECKDQQAEAFHLRYDEWDYRKRSYKPAYCKVYPTILQQSDTSYYTLTLQHHRRTLTDLRKMFARLYNAYNQQHRASHGEHLDIDALTDLFADLQAGHTPDERVYISSRKRNRQLSMLFLLDFSLSSDGYAHGNRIIDVEKQVSILFGEVLHEYGIDFQIDGFFSRTRNHTSYITLKAFDEPWHTGKMRIGAAQPAGYTRIGAALRHAASLLHRRPARNKKWLILLSDGKPTDYDRYEGRYGIEDIKQALREMRQQGIDNFALAIEERAKYYLPQMFGPNHYNILSSPREMVHALASLYRRLAR